jgi:hypothetical protein
MPVWTDPDSRFGPAQGLASKEAPKMLLPFVRARASAATTARPRRSRVALRGAWHRRLSRMMPG